MNCKHCGAEIKNGSAFCGNCGNAAAPEITYCPNCGFPLAADSAFCGNCGAVVGQNSSAPAAEQRARKEKKKSSAPLIAAVVALSLLLIAAAATAVFFVLRSSEPDEYVTLEIDPVPSESADEMLPLAGSISTAKYDARLTVNGKKVASVDRKDGEEAWDTEVKLEVGANSIVVVLEDEKGNRERKRLNVEYYPYEPDGDPYLYMDGAGDPLSATANEPAYDSNYDELSGLPYGADITRTTAARAAKDGILVRLSPSKSANVVYRIAPGDYNTVLTFLGESCYDAGNTTLLWYKVSTPAGVGWVRSDVVTVSGLGE